LKGCNRPTAGSARNSCFKKAHNTRSACPQCQERIQEEEMLRTGNKQQKQKQLHRAHATMSQRTGYRNG
jgi:predicted amidophosphoribosyltransferase